MIQQGDQSQPITGETVVTTLLLTDLVDSTKLVEQLGDAKAAEIFVRNDRVARDLLKQYNGKEIDKTDGFLFLFVRPIDAVLYSIAYHHALKGLSEQTSIKLSARAGIHLGEVILHRNSPDDVSRGAKPIEVEGIAKPLAARIMSLAQGGQTLITQAAFDLARRGVVGSDAAPEGTAWVAHGLYMLKGVDEPVEIFEAGVKGVAPLSAPPDTEKAKRSVAAGDEETLGWRPAMGLDIPHRTGWRLERKIGEGGFGEVWLAVHKRTKNRRVFKFCFDADRLRSLKRELTLFRLLRDALGDRKDIARLYEVQLEEPPFFLESEFTPSGSLIDWAESQGGINNVPIETRLDMVARTARAVAAAHSVGILHKDIKPGNILVYEDESGQPRPRLADFGIGTLTDRDQLTGRNITMAGFTSDLGSDDSSLATTRMYSPPELLAGRPFTVLGDIYAVGVFMYQMVVGDLDRPLAQGWERDVADSCLRDDIAVCVEGDEEQRMGSAQGLAKRLETLPQRRRAAWRKRLSRIGAVSAVVLAVLLVITGWLLLHERDLRRQITAQYQRAEVKLADKLWLDGDFESAEVHYRVALKYYRQQLGDESLEVAEILNSLGACLRPRAMFTEAEQSYRLALNIRRRLAIGENEVLIAQSLNSLALCYLDQDRYANAEPLLHECLELMQRLGLDDVQPFYYARILDKLAMCLAERKEFVRAERQFLESLALKEAEFGNEHSSVAKTRHALAQLMFDQGDFEQAEGWCHEALELQVTLLREQHPDIADSLHLLGEIHIKLSEFGEAEIQLRKALAIRENESPPVLSRIAETQSALGGCLVDLGRYEQAEPLLIDSLPILRDRWGQQNQRTQAVVASLIELYHAWGKPQRAEPYRAMQQQGAGSP
ncbi:MAG: tetratricopeptide repeat protein [Planctomycetes bacterium]|nr:tetratricopeptide repeat protein [Planctomycetota bacterium]